MKKNFLLLAFLACLFTVHAKPPVSEKIMAVFNASFPGATDVTWTEFEQYYQVYFVKDEIHCRVYYDLNGNVIKSRRDYAGDKLNPFLTAKLMKRFPDKKIYIVNEVTTEAESFFLVFLEGAKEWIQVRCEPTGNIHTLSKLKKG